MKKVINFKTMYYIFHFIVFINYVVETYDVHFITNNY